MRRTNTVKKPRVLNKRRDIIPSGAVYIGRGSKWGNPYPITEDDSREDVIKLYEDLIVPLFGKSQIQHELKGKDLVCFCAPKACHGDILLRIANE